MESGCVQSGGQKEKRKAETGELHEERSGISGRGLVNNERGSGGGWGRR